LRFWHVYLFPVFPHLPFPPDQTPRGFTPGFCLRVLAFAGQFWGQFFFYPSHLCSCPSQEIKMIFAPLRHPGGDFPPPPFFSLPLLFVGPTFVSGVFFFFLFFPQQRFWELPPFSPSLFFLSGRFFLFMPRARLPNPCTSCWFYPSGANQPGPP